MRRADPYRIGVAVLAAAGLLACGPPDGFTGTEWSVVQGLSPLPPVPPDPTNRYADDLGAAQLGRQLFFDTGYSGALSIASDLGPVGATGRVSCGACHQPERSFIDGRSPEPGNVSLGAAGYGRRNSPSLLNVGHARWIGLAGRMDTLWTQGSVAPEAPDAAGDRCRMAHFIWRDYRAEYEAVFTSHPLPPALDPAAPDAWRFPAACRPCAGTGCSGPWEAMQSQDRVAVMRLMSNVGKAFAAYQRRLVSGEAPFDRYAAGDPAAISASAKRGLKVFIGKGFCVQCHAGPTFSDQQFHNIGVPQTGPHVPATDSGRYEDAGRMLDNLYNGVSQFSDDVAAGQAKLEGVLRQQPADLGAFLTRGLRGVAGSPPYGHSGSLATLRDVVDLYAAGGGLADYTGTKDVKMQPLDLSEQDREDLVAFLESLSGQGPGPEWGRP